MIDHFTTEQTSQAERLIGFAVVLFTILGIGMGQFSKFFPYVTEVFSKMLPQSIGCLEWLRFLLLFLIISFLLTLMFRSVFRFTLFGGLSTTVRYVTETDVLSIHKEMSKKSKSVTLHQAIHRAAFKYLENAKTLGIPTKWFVTEEKWRGWGFCIFLAAVSTLLIMFVLW